MSVKRTNETTFKDNKNAKENLLKFSTTKFPQNFHETTQAATHVTDFETEMEMKMEKETKILKTIKGKEMPGIFALNKKTEAAGTNHQHLQEQFNKSNYSTSSSASATSALRAQNKAQKAIEMLEIKQQQTPNDLSNKKTQSLVKQAEDARETLPTCLNIYICDPPSASIFQRSPLFWRCCCLCPNTLKLCSPILRDLLFLFCFIFILTFLIFSAAFAENYLKHNNETLCHDCLL